MSFRGVFAAITIATGLVVAAFLLHSRRPGYVLNQPSPEFIRATGKCAECHANAQHSVVHEFEMSVHAREGINCLDCHQVASGQEGHEHNGFVINAAVTPANCRACHESIYQEFARSRHGAPSWAAVAGTEGFTEEQIAAAERFHPGAVRRPPNALAMLEGSAATTSGCMSCHSVGRPNMDGSIGNCTACHTRHTSSVEFARLPTTCGQCHMGPDHSQLEIYSESKHGIMFAAQRNLLNLRVPPKELTTRDMFVPTCATCHMSGLNGRGVTHDPSERLSYFLFADVSEARPNALQARTAMQAVCTQCHTPTTVERVFTEADAVVESTNEKVRRAQTLMDGLRDEGLLTGGPYDQPIEFEYFDLWHYYGRTAKHGAFMGGADFVQWHGNYPILQHLVEMQATAEEMRRQHAAGD